MTPWLVCLATLGLGALMDWRTRRIPIWLPAVPVLTLAGDSLAWSGAWPVPQIPLFSLLLSAGLVLAAVTVLMIALVGWGDVALMVPIALILGVWVTVALAASLALGLWTLAWRGRPDDPFVPHLLVGFLIASAARWTVGG